MPMETNPADVLLMTANKICLESVTVEIECNASSTEKSVAIPTERSAVMSTKSPQIIIQPVKQKWTKPRLSTVKEDTLTTIETNRDTVNKFQATMIS